MKRRFSKTAVPLVLVAMLVLALWPAVAQARGATTTPPSMKKIITPSAKPSFQKEFGIFYDEASGPNGDLYISDSLNNRIIKTKIDGTGWTVLGGVPGTGVKQFHDPRGIFFDHASGFIYVTDCGNHRIVKTKIDGGGWTTYGTKGNGVGQFYFPRGLWYDATDNLLYVPDTGNNRIVQISGNMDGSGWSTLGTVGRGAKEFLTPRGVQYDHASQTLFVADTGNSRIVSTKWDGTGWVSLGSYGSGTKKFKVPRGVHYDPTTQLVYVADQSNNRIVATKMDGTGWTTYGTFGNGTGQFYFPRGISLDPGTGDVYVADTFNDRIVKTQMNGSGWTSLGAKWKPYTWYFAEGTTRSDSKFQMFLTILNPGATDATVNVRYLLGPGQGTVPDQSILVAAHTRYTINVKDQVGADKDVSVRAWSSQPVIIERPMYFNYHGWPGGDVVMGRPQPDTSFYFAEGTTRDGFQTFVCLQNPDTTNPANVTIQYMFSGAPPQTQSVIVAPHSRSTIHVNDVVGPGKDVSIVVTSDIPIVAERPMYFKYQGRVTGAHVVIGASEPETNFYLAEGTTNPGFDEYICMLNPGKTDATVDLTYMFKDGTNQSQTVTVPASQRYTIHVNDVVGNGKDVSVQIGSDQPIVVERPMYFVYRLANGQKVVLGGHNVMAVSDPGTSFLFAEGTTRPGFDEWICLMNPSDVAASVTITYMFNAGTPSRTQTISLIPHSRSTVSVNQTLQGWGLSGQDVSLQVNSTQPIVAERPMYFDDNGITGGSNTVGFSQ